MPTETHSIDVDGVLDSENVYLDPKFVDHNSLFLREVDHITYDPQAANASQESSFISVNDDQFAHSSSMMTGVSTYLDHPFQSEDVKKLISLRLENEDDKRHYSGIILYYLLIISHYLSLSITTSHYLSLPLTSSHYFSLPLIISHHLSSPLIISH